MTKIDPYEQEILAAVEQGELKSVATKAELEKLTVAARATATKDRRVDEKETPEKHATPARKRAGS